MAFSILSLIAVMAALVCQATCTTVNGGKDIFCARAQITEVRIEGCDAEPCQITKGDTVPIEFDFSFQTPDQSDNISFNVFLPYWNGGYGEYIGEANGCADIFPDDTCPLQAQTSYTLKSSIYIDPTSKDSLSGADTGKRNTGWSLNIQGADSAQYSTCLFNVDINIVA